MCHWPTAIGSKPPPTFRPRTLHAPPGGHSVQWPAGTPADPDCPAPPTPSAPPAYHCDRSRRRRARCRPHSKHTTKLKCGRGLAPDSSVSVSLWGSDPPQSGASPLPHLDPGRCTLHLEAIAFNSLLAHLPIQTALLHQRRQRRQHLVMAIHLKEVTQRRPRITATEAVGAEYGVARVDVRSDHLRHRPHVIGHRHHRCALR